MLSFIVAAALSGVACANPSIVSAGVESISTNGGLHHYNIAITVRNQGNVRQPSNLLQSIDVLQDDQRVGKIGLQPLRPKQAQKVIYGFERSVDAGSDTTNLTFTLDLNGRSGNNVDCHAGVESLTITV